MTTGTPRPQHAGCGAPGPAQRAVELFPTDQPVPLAELIGRSSEAAVLVEGLEAGSHQVLTGADKSGKTSLANAVAATCEQAGWTVVRVDLFRQASLEQLIATLAGSGRAADEDELTLTAAIERFAADAGTNRVLLVIDSFHELVTTHVFGKVAETGTQLRAALAAAPNVRCLFVGGAATSMRSLFTVKDQPFHRFGHITTLSDITESAWRPGLTTRFAEGGCPLTADGLDQLLAVGEGHARTTMLVAQHAYAAAVGARREVVDADVVHIGAASAAAAERSLADHHVARMRGLSKHALTTALRVAAGESPYKHLPPAMARQTLRLLETAGIVDHPKSSAYRIVDPLLRRHLIALTGAEPPWPSAAPSVQLLAISTPVPEPAPPPANIDTRPDVTDHAATHDTRPAEAASASPDVAVAVGDGVAVTGSGEDDDLPEADPVSPPPRDPVDLALAALLASPPPAAPADDHPVAEDLIAYESQPAEQIAPEPVDDAPSQPTGPAPAAGSDAAAPVDSIDPTHDREDDLVPVATEAARPSDHLEPEPATDDLMAPPSADADEPRPAHVATSAGPAPSHTPNDRQARRRRTADGLTIVVRHPVPAEAAAIGDHITYAMRGAPAAARDTGGNVGARIGRFIRHAVAHEPERYWQVEIGDRAVGGVVLRAPRALVGRDTATGLDPITQAVFLAITGALLVSGLTMLVVRQAWNWGAFAGLIFAAFIAALVQIALLTPTVATRARASWTARRSGGHMVEAIWSEPDALPDVFRQLARELPGLRLSGYADTPEQASALRDIGFCVQRHRYLAGTLDPDATRPVTSIDNPPAAPSHRSLAAPRPNGRATTHQTRRRPDVIDRPAAQRAPRDRPSATTTSLRRAKGKPRSTHRRR